MTEFSGTLRERITIERPLGARNALGLPEHGWEFVARCSAAIIPEGVASESEGMALSAMQRFKVIIRNREGVAIDQRVRWRSRHLAVRQLLFDPRAVDRLTLRCEEVRS